MHSTESEKAPSDHLEKGSADNVEEWLHGSRHFSLNPDFHVPEEVLERATSLEFTDDEERALKWKLDLR